MENENLRQTPQCDLWSTLGGREVRKERERKKAKVSESEVKKVIIQISSLEETLLFSLFSKKLLSSPKNLRQRKNPEGYQKKIV